MTTLATLLVKLGLDSADYESGMDKAGKTAQKGIRSIQASIDKLNDVGDKLSMRVSLPLLALGGVAVKAASDTSESLNKVNVVFGQSSSIITQFAKDSARDLGMAKQAAYEATGTFGNLFTSMGMGQGKAAEMSTELVTLAADLASFNNIDPAQALDKLRSGLVGEAEPLRALGVNINAAAVEAEALRLGFEKSGATFDQVALVTARYSLIVQQTKNAQGDFARTSDGLANSTRIAKAQLQDAAATLGEKLIPMATTAIGKVSDLATAFGNLDGPTQGMIVNLGLIAIAAGPAIKGISGLAQAALSLLGFLGPVGVAIAGLSLIVVGLGYALGGIPKAASEATTALANKLTDPQQKLADLEAQAKRLEKDIKLWPDQPDLLIKWNKLQGLIAAARKEINTLGANAPHQIQVVGDAAITAATKLGIMTARMQALLSESVPKAPTEHFGLLEPGIPAGPDNSTFYMGVADRLAEADALILKSGQSAAKSLESAYSQAVSNIESVIGGAQSHLEGL
ncbi:MAG: hypothetical protein WC718_18915, partial [Phycisphaerales bacterium]